MAVADDGFYWGTSDRYEIAFYDGRGELRRILRRPVEPRPVTDALVEEYRAAFLESVREREGEGALPRYRRSLEETTYGNNVPLFRTSFVDGNRRLWVSEWSMPYRNDPPRRWSVFAEDGIWLGDVEAPADVSLRDARNDVVLGIRTDELGVQYVQLHRLVEPGNGT